MQQLMSIALNRATLTVENRAVPSGDPFFNDENGRLEQYLDQYGMVKWGFSQEDIAEAPSQPTWLKISLDFALETAKLGENWLGEWLRANDLRKYMALRIMQSRSSAETDTIIRGKKQIPPEPDEYSIFPFTDRVVYFADIRQSADKRYFINTTFEIPTDEPRHLTYFYGLMVDYEAIVRDFDLDLPPTEFAKSFQSNIQYATIIEDYRLLSHKVQDFRIFSRIQQSQFDFTYLDLKLAEVLNYDFRRTYDIRRSFVALVGNTVMGRATDGSCTFSFDFDMRRAIEENSAYSQHFKKFDNPVLLDAATDLSSIKQITVTRRRVERDMRDLIDSLGYRDFNQIDELIVFSRDNGNQLLEQSYKIDADGDGTPETIIGSIREISPVTPRIRRLAVVDQSVAGVNVGQYQYSVSLTIEDGTYKLLETYRDKLCDAQQDLQQYYNTAVIPARHYSGLQGFGVPQVDWSTAVGHYDAVTNRFTQQFVDLMNEKYPGGVGAPWLLPVVVLLEALQIFADSSLQTDLSRLAQTLVVFAHPITGTPTGITKVVDVFSNLIDKFNQIVRPPNDPTTARIYTAQRGGAYPKRTFEITKRLATVYDRDVRPDIGVDFLGVLEDVPGGIVDIPRDSIGVRHIGMAAFRSRIQREALKYFNRVDADISLATPQRVYTKNDMLRNNMSAYLAPSIIVSPNRKPVGTLASAGADAWDGEIYTDVATDVAHYATFGNTFSKDAKDAKDAKDTKNSTKVRNLNAVLGATNTQVGLFQPQIVASPEMVQPQPRAVIPDNFNFGLPAQVDEEGQIMCRDDVDQDGGQDAHELQFELLPHVGQRFRPKMRFFDVSQPGNSLDMAGLSSEQVRNLPNQVKSLMLRSTKPDIVKTNDALQHFEDVASEAVVKMNYLTIGRVEALVGHEVDEKGHPLIECPKWQLLTDDVLRNLGKETVCRIEYFNQEELGIGVDKDYQLPMYDQHFVLSRGSK